MTYSIKTAGKDDAEDLVTIMQTAFADHHIMPYMHKDVPQDLQFQDDLDLFREWLAEGDIYGARFTKAIDNDTGQTVAFARWVYPVKLTAQQAAEKGAKEEERKQRPHPQGTNVALTDDFFNQLARGRKKWVDPEQTFHLHILAVLPSHQRKGLGSMLITPPLNAADAAGAQAYVEASLPGYPLYLKYGWEVCDEMLIDMTPHGGQGIAHQNYLLRQPGASMKVKA